MPRYALKRLFLLLLLPVSILSVALASRYPALTEQYYSSGFYAVVAPALSSLTGLFFVSLAELSIIFGVLVLILYTACTVRAAVKDPQRRVYTLYTYVVNLCVVGTLL
ncbi:MAG: hypothetical protein ACERKO_06430, partial [Acetanaerobacterium sp.]